jgi:hypothetical protein
MNWVVFSYTVPSKPRSSFRVSVWRRLGRLGALSTTSGVYILPARDECVEALQWLAQETRQAGGEALVMRVDQFEGLADNDLIERFNQARACEYEAIDTQADAIEKSAHARRKARPAAEMQEALARLRRRYLDIARVDYFACPRAGPLSLRLDAIEQTLAPRHVPDPGVPVATVAEYGGRRWVTRPRPHVDRLACIWLIRHFINPQALIRYADRAEPDEIAFDMPAARFGHEGNRCSFETLLAAFGLAEPALQVMAQIVHEIDLRDGLYARPGTVGIDSVLSGWLLANYSDAELEAHGMALFEGLYLTLSARSPLEPLDSKLNNRRKQPPGRAVPHK